MTQKQKIIRKLNPLLSNKSQDDFEQHIEWYLKYLALIHSKKNLVQQWKESKYNQNNHHPSSLTELDAAESQINEMFSIDKNDNNNTGTDFRTEEEKRLMKDRIQHWKKEKEDNLKQKKDLENLVQQQKQRDEEEKLKKRNLELKVSYQVS